MTTDAQHSSVSDVSVTRPYGQGRRAFYGLLWTFWTIVLFAGAVGLFSESQTVPGLVALALAAITLRYTYRIWTWQARRLVFFIVF